MADASSGFAGAAANIRETGKWLLAAFAAIGAVLIAGFEFSGVAELTPPELFFALGSGAVGLLGLGWAITGVANLLLPRSYTMHQLEVNRKPESEIRDALNARPELLDGYQNVSTLAGVLDAAIAAATEARRRWQAAPPVERAAAQAELEVREQALTRISQVTANAGDWANYLGLRNDYYRAFRRRILPGVLVAVLGFGGALIITAASDSSSESVPSLSKATVPAGASFAKAQLAGANLSEAHMAGVDFTDADLTGANMAKAVFAGANFTRANLRGAKLDGAGLEGATWSGTICPDGENSSFVGGSCDAHLTLPGSAAGDTQ